ncbi:MAG: phosphate signaling complex protein PhoU [Treponema sp.]|jgi:phosphate transport system protein|nr:phosphate signaling complex protein PhoU [Treponema sp.]
MRDTYLRQLESLHSELIKMGALCEEAIAGAVKGLLEDDPALRRKAADLEKEIDLREREIEAFCIRLILREQPVAGDLRQITAAQKMIADMDRIGDQAADIAELSGFLEGSGAKSRVHIGDMARAAGQMLTGSVDAFVASDLEKARAVMAYDDVVDDLFVTVRGELIEMIGRDSSAGAACFDLLMIAKHLERIGDHARNIAKWVEYSITGIVPGQQGRPD